MIKARRSKAVAIKSRENKNNLVIPNRGEAAVRNLLFTTLFARSKDAGTVK
jgi:hypothetical protein